MSGDPAGTDGEAPGGQGCDVCLVEADPLARQRLERTLTEAGYRVQACASPAEALARIEPSRPVQIVLDEESLQRVLARASQHVRLRAEVEELKRRLTLGERFPEVVGESPGMREVLRLVENVAPTDAPVLLLGEPGTGKELVARALHARSRRHDRGFVAVHGAALAAPLVESELFGHHAGAFPGATADRVGLLEQASGGTLYLDEIAALPDAVQGGLLRALEEKVVVPLGGQARPVDLRVVAATAQDPRLAVRDGRLREDLLQRLHVVALRLPPLRERREDLPTLAQHLVRKQAAHAGKTVERLEPDAMQALLAHDWPGNVRELENALRQAVLLAARPALGLRDLPDSLRRRPGASDPGAPRPPGEPPPFQHFAEAKKAAVSSFERGYLQSLLAEVQGNVAEAARRAGLDKANFRRLLRRNALASSNRELSRT